MTNAKVAIITPSYRNDFENAVDLCRSIDTFCQFDFEHLVIVPQSDMKLFASLQGPRRRVMARESILRPHGFIRLPVPTIIKLPFGKTLRLREQYYLPGVGRISGWLVQQIVKLCAGDLTKADVFIFADSDVFLVRPFSLEALQSGGQLILQQHVRGRDLDTHRLWRKTAHELLGVGKPRETEHFNYIGQLIPWDRATLDGLIRRIQSAKGPDWQRAIAKAKTVSEYILYGEYVVEIAAVAEPRPIKDMKLANSVWSPDAVIDVEAIIAAMEPENIAVHIQSTNPLPIAERRAAIATISGRVLDPQVA
ncbi:MULTISPECIES: DUF6492 family protein [Rhizobium]|uniref:DUF6492 family protein n=1 Tax=Rhizobium rhododendri TaxID=2506430 RepID=A0ABY8IGZ7_9HYPH|nr:MULTISPECIES: DUF6492 family protein [Rhizobium]MBZ5759723.1 DUF6492 family protein [Rhizobium sp. VS19-DR96]MBZ5766111.1 DUF6492 family protein [Rhizobium sp. VS19-DR129.2]MBZ5772894.1 DUF6492 family protein [Rhizobium sp. VS19-DRK62.2]MBZ5786634.1 DUF6492 family protein [Rhizobium sp. VS19-DR121]MBZ5804342.1 DUF6492 family protein [Rhizobium sp. VS19-DR181]